MTFGSLFGLILPLIFGINGEHNNETATVLRVEYDRLKTNFLAQEETLFKLYEERRKLDFDLEQRNIYLLALRVKSRIAELEQPGGLLWPQNYRDPLQMTRKQRWTLLLTSTDKEFLDSKNVQRFRTSFFKSLIGVKRFLENLVPLHEDSSDMSVRPLTVSVPDERENIEDMYEIYYGIPDPVEWEIITVFIILDPFDWNKPSDAPPWTQTYRPF
ncbi:unnamed protein product [Bemisia tabaci]|uniref:Uncharacterized protein n=1 Tax=Bemisia tabaci TaxID=7038 RepID=A0A9P0F4P9_BEMTA|nr:unnamed protein product [Bemisia tabaci]